MHISVADSEGMTMMRELRDPELRAELLDAVKAWKGVESNETGDSVLLLLEDSDD